MQSQYSKPEWYGLGAEYFSDQDPRLYHLTTRAMLLEAQANDLSLSLDDHKQIMADLKAIDEKLVAL